MSSQSLTRLTQAPLPVELDGKTYELSPHRLLEQAEFDQWIDLYPLQKAVRMLKACPELPKEYQNRLWEQAANLRMERSLVVEAMTSAEGVALLFWLSLRIRHPALTLEEVKRLLTNWQLDELQTLLNEVNGRREIEKEVTAASDPLEKKTETLKIV